MIFRMTVKNFSSLFLFSGSVYIRRLKISRHYFVFFCFLFLSLALLVGSVRMRRLKVSRHFFVFSLFYSLYLLYYAQDSCKKWQENEGKLGLISRMTVKTFLVTIFFFSFFGVSGSVRIRQPKISRHYFVFFFFSLFMYYTTRRIVVKSDKKKKASLVWFPDWTVSSKSFLSLFCFCFLSFLCISTIQCAG